MRTVSRQLPGAARPPFRLGVRAAFAAAFVLLLVRGEDARAQEVNECRYIGTTPIRAEGFDGPDTFGFRLVLRKDGWGWGPAHGGAIAACPLCSTGLAKGVLRIGLAPFYAPSDEYVLRRETGQQEASAVEFALHPRTIAVGLWSMTNFVPRNIVADSDITPVRVLDAHAMARAFTIISTGPPVHGVALGMKDRCLKFFGLFFREDNGPLAVSAIHEVDQFMSLERYTPRFSLEQLTPRPPPPPRIPFPLGDARKRMMEDENLRHLLK
jgi:hypothetical protein